MNVKQQKKVLILGGNRHLIHFVEAFNAEGIYTFVTDDMMGATAKEHADQSTAISPADVIALSELVKAEGITGIFAELSDITTWNAIALCKKTSLPFYFPVNKASSEARKLSLQEYCRVFGVPIEEHGESSCEMNVLPPVIINWTEFEKSRVSLVG